MNTFWLTNGKLITPRGIVRGAVGIRAGRIVAVRPSAPSREGQRNVRGRYISPGFIDLHIWGNPSRVAAQEIRFGTTSFLTAIGPESPHWLANHLVRLNSLAQMPGARCLGAHLEGPFLNPMRAGALASRWLRPPTKPELRQILRCAGGRLKLVTLAPELPGSLEAIRALRAKGVVVSLGHSDAAVPIARQAIERGAAMVTHIFNGMRPLHHRAPGLLGQALTDDRVTTMVILDGVHVDPIAFRLLLRCKGAERIVLATDSVRNQDRLKATLSGGAYRKASGMLAGSRLTMIEAVRNAVLLGSVPLVDAVRMAAGNPAQLIGSRDVGELSAGKRADLVVFDERFRVDCTLVGGKVVYQRAR